MTRLDDLLGQLTVEVPEAPPVDELRSRVGHRHRRSVPVAAVLISLIVTVVLIRIGADEQPAEDALAIRPEPGSELRLTRGPLSFEISVSVHPNPVVEMSQFNRTVAEWIPESYPAAKIRLAATSTSIAPVRLTAPTWEGRTERGIVFLGNTACTTYFVCLLPNEDVTLANGGEHAFAVYVQPRLAPPDDYSFTTQFAYENITTGETGTIPVDIQLRIWVPEHETEPPPMSATTIMLPLPPSPSTTATL